MEQDGTRETEVGKWDPLFGVSLPFYCPFLLKTEINLGYCLTLVALQKLMVRPYCRIQHLNILLNTEKLS